MDEILNELLGQLQGNTDSEKLIELINNNDKEYVNYVDENIGRVDLVYPILNLIYITDGHLIKRNSMNFTELAYYLMGLVEDDYYEELNTIGGNALYHLYSNDIDIDTLIVILQNSEKPELFVNIVNTLLYRLFEDNYIDEVEYRNSVKKIYSELILLEENKLLLNNFLSNLHEDVTYSDYDEDVITINLITK